MKFKIAKLVLLLETHADLDNANQEREPSMMSVTVLMKCHICLVL